MFYKKGVLRSFTKFTGKHLCQSLFFNKVAGFIKKETLAQVFSCEFYEISKNTFFYRTSPVAAPKQDDPHQILLKGGLHVRSKLIHLYLNDGDKVCKCKSCFKFMKCKPIHDLIFSKNCCRQE